jgi:hypothetical protein
MQPLFILLPLDQNVTQQHTQKKNLIKNELLKYDSKSI